MDVYRRNCKLQIDFITIFFNHKIIIIYNVNIYIIIYT